MRFSLRDFVENLVMIQGGNTLCIHRLSQQRFTGLPHKSTPHQKVYQSGDSYL